MCWSRDFHLNKLVEEHLLLGATRKRIEELSHAGLCRWVELHKLRAASALQVLELDAWMMTCNLQKGEDEWKAIEQQALNAREEADKWD